MAELQRESRLRIGVDLGGTKIEAIVLGAANEVVFRERVPTESARGYEHIIATIGGLVDVCRRRAPDVEVIGIGTPGAISARTGLMKNSNTTCLNGRALHTDLERRIGLPLRMENDANLFAFAEALVGAGQGERMVFGVILGTGVGGGIVYRGELLHGPQYLAGEWGHHSIDPNGPECYCGQRGCVETFIAGPAVERDFIRRGGAAASMQEIVRAARAGDVLAAVAFEAFLERFGRALANVIGILDPDVIVLGGGLSNIDELYDRGRDAVVRRMFNDELLTPIVRNRLGDSAGVIGAALLT